MTKRNPATNYSASNLPFARALLSALVLFVVASGCVIREKSKPVGGYNGLAPYEACGVSNDCDPNYSEACIETPSYIDLRPTPYGRICSAFCYDDRDCELDIRGNQGSCLSFDGNRTKVCYERCSRNADCPSGMECVEKAGTSTFRSVCMAR